MPAASPVISRSVPAYETGGFNPAGNANDGDYNTRWRSVGVPSSGSPQILTYDLASVPSGKRGLVAVAWYNELQNYYPNNPADEASYVTLPKDYTIQGNPAGTAGSPPSSGWVTLATVTGNVNHTRVHVVDMTGHNWLRMRITASHGPGGNDDVALQMDVHDISGGFADIWHFYGDSWVLEGIPHRNGLANVGWTAGGFSGRIATAKPERFPVTISAGLGGQTASGAVAVYANWVANFQAAGYTPICFGVNDANGGGGALSAPAIAQYKADMLTLVDAEIAAGRIPVIPTIPYTTLGGATRDANVQALNGKIAEIYAARPTVVHGPDLYAFFAAHSDLLWDGLHPTYDAGSQATYAGLVGYEHYNRLWAEAMLATVYAQSSRGSGGALGRSFVRSANRAGGRLFRGAR